MSEELPLQEASPASEPLTTSGIPEADKKRVIIGSAIGGGVFLGVLVALIILVSTEERQKPKPPPPKPTIYPHYNPYIVDTFVKEHEHLIRINLINNRKILEKDTVHYSDPYGYIPIVKEDYENPEPQRLAVAVIEHDEHLARIIYYDPDFERWHVPYFGNYSDPYSYASFYTRNPSGFHLNEKVNGSFQWYYESNINKSSSIIDTYDCRLQYFDKYIEFEALLERDYIYGMGERIESFHLKNDNYSLWNRHFAADHTSDTEIGLSGSHPFILNRQTDNQKHDFIGLFMRNSNAMLFSMWDNVRKGTTINYKIIGGVIDLFIFHTASPQYILRKYHSVIGRPYLPPVWAMGLHQAREYYKVADLNSVIENYRKHHLPVDAVWADTEMYEDHKTFTVNKISFAGIKELVQKLHDHQKGYDMHFVAMAHPALVKDEGYKYYVQAVKEDALIKSAHHYDHPFEGRTASKVTVWLDFFLHNATLIWGGGLHDMFEQTLFDGIWIIDDEINHECNGECSMMGADAEETVHIPNPFHNASEFDYIPYRPTVDPLEMQTLPMAAYHFGDEMYNKQYYAHNLFGIQIARATFEGLRTSFENKRFFLASRSTWPGSGQFGSHWLDGNYATWESMQTSIPSILNFNMFGIPHVGAPIGGFYSNATDELLVRWFELGAFYPLMLSYTSSITKAKEAFAIPEHIETINNALHERYSLIRFMYSKMFESHLWGGAVVHPLFFDFTNDTKLYDREILDRTFMWASTLYIIPALIPHQTSVRAYLPNWRWYDLRTFDLISEYSPEDTQGHYVDFPQPLGTITVLIKGGSVIPHQYMSKDSKVANTKDLEIIPTRLIVAPDHEGKAVGSMVVDNEGIIPNPDPRSNTYRHYTFTYMNQIFRANKLAGFEFHTEMVLDEFWELVILDKFSEHQVDFVCMMDMSMRKKNLQHMPITHGNILQIHDEGYTRMKMATLESIVWGSKEQHDFCQFQVHIEEMRLTDSDRRIIGVLGTTDPEAYQLRYNFAATAINNHIVHFTVEKNEPGVVEWKVPSAVVDETIKTTLKGDKTLDAVGFGVSHPHENFFFEMSEEYDPHDYLITTRHQPFVYVRNFIQVRFLISARHIFGLGERVGRFELADGTYSLWNYDFMHEETGVPPGNNMHSSHPFYLIHTHNPFDFAGVFFLTTNPMDVRVKHIAIETEVDHILSGGILELFLINQNTAENVIKQYHYLIGKPIPLPFWAFGYHQSRWGYKDIDHLKLVVRRFEDENIPLDGVWMDKDFMVDFKSFTIDTKRWYGLEEFVRELHAKGKHFVAIVDPGIAKEEGFKIYDDGLTANVYIKSNETKEALMGITWAGYSVWVDFLHPAASNFWESALEEFHKKVNFDALWLDMNEPSNFCDGECHDRMTYHYYYFPLDYYDDLYYNPTHRPLEARTLSMEALHAGYETSKTATEFNYHNLYGFYQSRVTSNFFISRLKKRPFIISGSTFPGSGRYVAHWLGDNYSRWSDMEHSIAGMIHFGMFGIPYVGANICGYSGNATEELCARWMQLGAFYPFMRNHNCRHGSPQEPYVSEKVKVASKTAILARYSLVRYIYSEYMETVIHGGTLIKPLIFYFPDDNETYTTLDTSFMVGPAIRVTPILADGTDKVRTYFPNADWFTYSDPHYEQVHHFNETAHHGKYVTVHSGLVGRSLNVHIRGGTILTVQEVSEGIHNVLGLHNLPINLIVVPDHQHSAYGEVFYDTESTTDFKNEHQDVAMHCHEWDIDFSLKSGKQEVKYNKTDMYIDKIIFLGAEYYQKAVVARYETKSGQTINMKPPVYSKEHRTLTLQAVDAHSMNVMQLNKIHWADKA